MRLGFAFLLALLVGLSHAQSYPAKPVHLIVTFTPGGAADFTARLVADRWSEMWQQQVIVENRIGAGGNIGAEAVAKAPADGYTLLLVASAHAFNAALYPKLPFDIVRDFVPLGLATSTPMALAVNPRLPITNLKEFTELLQRRPHEIQYATCGVATAHHFAMELYKYQTKTDAVHVPYRGCGPAVVDAVGGQIDVVMSSLTTVLPHAKAGRLRTLAITSENRSPSGMTADIFPLSPNMPDLHVIWSGAAGRPATATCPVTSPEAQPSVIPPSTEMAAAAVTLLHIWSSLRSWVHASRAARR